MTGSGYPAGYQATLDLLDLPTPLLVLAERTAHAVHDRGLRIPPPTSASSASTTVRHGSGRPPRA
jgi:hypothetical protein